MAWSNFFTVLLLSPSNFEWVKSLLSSKIPEFLQSDTGTIEFSIPVSCPDNSLCCSTVGEENGQGREVGGSQDVPSSSSRKRNAKKISAIVETEVRRSTRLKESAKGFKSKSCTNKKCLACAPDPPILKKDVIKKLAFDFCKLDDSELNDDLLRAKRKKTHPIARARIVIGVFFGQSDTGGSG